MGYEIKYQTFDNFLDLETVIFKEIKTSHLYIAEEDLFNNATCYF